ncbi:Mu transposase C-terminal domain-containing protein [Microvirga sp. GCM10011540]|uniref:Mu transposase C-terminal domain-containing protein n=1 Tax=Microvirga sp. GCM10011540 TaxID=3317338 RepID=UPI0036168A17
MTHQTNSVTTPRFGAGKLDRIRIGDIAYRRVKCDRDAMTLVRCDGEGLHEVFTHAHLFRLLDEDHLHVDRDFFAPGKGRLRLIYGDLKLTDLDPETQKLVNWRSEFVERFLKLSRSDKRFTRSDTSLGRAIERIGDDIDADRKIGKPNVRPGRIPDQPQRPSPTQLRRWIKRFEDGDCERVALVPRYARSGNTKTVRMEAEVRGVLNRIVPTYASNLRPSGKEIHARIAEEIGKLNAERAARRLPGQKLTELKVPSLKTVYRAIHKLDAFHVLAGRKGKEHARKKFFVVHEGVEVTRLLERVEMDTWEVQLMNLLVDLGLWEGMTEEQRKAVTRVRCSLTAAIDCASRYLLALDLRVGSPSGAGAVAALQMITADKTALSTACGAQIPWHGRGTPESILTDRGPEYIHDYFRSTVSDLAVTHMLAPAGLPQMRGTVERLFRTIDSTLLSKLSGRTHSNPQDRGDYKASEQASLTVEELREILYRWVEVYHNTPHEGLGGETPEEAWARLAKDCEVRPAPSPSQARHIFGVRAHRRIGNRGIRFLGLHYQSLQLQQYRRQVNQQPVLIRVDPRNLGEISFFTDEGWMSAACVQDFAQGLTAAEWMAATRRLRERFANLAALKRPVVIAAIQAIREMSAAAMTRAGLASPVMTEEEFRKAELDLYRTFRIRDGKVAQSDEEDVLGIGDDAVPEPIADETDDEHDHTDDRDAAGDAITSPYGDADDWRLED